MSAARLALGLPALLAVLLFARALGGGFVYDDRPLLSENPRMQSVSVIGEAFTRPYWELVDDRRDAAGFYRPVGATALALGWQVSGGQPWVFKLLSLLLHAGTSAAVAALALAMGWRPAVAGAAGALFAVHGGHVEAVVWISAIPELLATLFSVLALRALVLRRTAWSALWLLLAMLSKEAAFGVWLLALGVMLLRPAAAAEDAGDGARNAAPSPRRLPSLALLIAPALLVYLLRANAFGVDGGWSWAAGFDRVTTHHGLSGADQIGLSLSLLGRYLGYLVWPWPHQPFNALRLDVGWADVERLLPAILGVLAALAAGAAWLLRGRRSTLILIALGLTFAGVVPVLNTRALGQFPFEERFVYLPSAGFCLLAAGLLLNAKRATVRSAAPMVLLLFGVGNMISALSATPHWSDEESLFGWAREVSPDSMTPHVEYGRVMLERAQGATDPRDRAYYSDQAFDAYQRSLKVDPDKVLVTAIEREKGNLGQADALFLEGDFRSAQRVYEQIVGHYLDSAIGYLGLGNSHAMLGVVAGMEAAQASGAAQREARQAEGEEHFRRALDAFDRSLALDPGLITAQAGKAQVLGYLGRFGDALPFAEAAFEWQPENFDYAQSLASIYAELGRMTFARRTLERFLEAAPNHPQRAVVEQTIAALRAESG